VQFDGTKGSDASRLDIRVKRSACEGNEFIGRCVSGTLIVSDVDDGET
jgi:hypothetical protein